MRKRSTSSQVKTVVSTANARTTEPSLLPALIVHHNHPAGSGANGAVFHATLIIEDEDKQEIRVPCIAKPLQSQNRASCAVHNNLTNDTTSADSGLLTLIGILPEFNNPSQQHAVLPACELVLSDIIDEICKLRGKNPTLFQTVVIAFLEQISLGLKTLQTNRQVHRDIKPQNIGLRNGRFCIFDFDTLIHHQDFSAEQIIKGSPIYIPPELFLGKQETPECVDYYAVGQILCQFLGIPFAHINSVTAAAPSTLQDVLTAKRLAYTAASLNPQPVTIDAQDFATCSLQLQAALCHPLPHHRATQEILEASLARLKMLAPDHNSETQQREMHQFFLEIENKKSPTTILPTPRHATRAKRSPSTTARDQCAKALEDNQTAAIITKKRTAGKGANGHVFHGSILIRNSDRIPCVVKNTEGGRKLHEQLTKDETTASSGILASIAAGQEHQVLPRCEMMLSDCVKSIAALNASTLQTDRVLFEAIIIDFLERLILGLSTLEKNQVVHLDLKPENLGRRNGKWCMLDFDTAKTFSDYRKLEHLIGTILYTSPEVLTSTVSDHYPPIASDIFSVGLILRALCGLPIHKGIDVIDNPTTLCWQRGQVYMQAKQHADAHQFVDLRTKIDQSITFSELLNNLHESMTTIAPEGRPDLNTLRIALEKLKTLSPAYQSREVTTAVQRFFLEIESEQNNAQHSFTKKHCSDSFNNTDNTDSTSSSSGNSPPQPDQTNQFKGSPKTPKDTPAKITSTPKKTERPLQYSPGQNRFALLALGGSHNPRTLARKKMQTEVANPAKVI